MNSNSKQSISKKLALPLLTIALSLSHLLTSCEGDESLYLLKNDLPITFTPQTITHQHTINPETDSTFKQFELYAYNTGPNLFNGNCSEPNFIYGQKVKKHSSGSWHYAPLRHWNINPNEKLSFFAFTPNDTTQGALTLKTLYGFPILHYNMSSRPNYNIELLTAKAINQTKSALRTELFFRQSLSKVVFHLYSDAPITSKISVQQVVITQMHCSADFHFEDSSWQNHQEPCPLPLISRTQRATPPALSHSVEEVLTLHRLIIPQESSNRQLKIYLTVDHHPMVYTQHFTHPTWQANRSYHYLIKLTPYDCQMTHSVHYWHHNSNSSTLKP